MGSLCSCSFDRPWSAVFATWFRIRCLLGLAIIGSAVSIGFSASQTQSNQGDFKTLTASYQGFNWDSNVCNASPYEYLSPFLFTFTFGGKSYNNPSYCPWPVGNTAFRFLVASLFFLFSISLFWEQWVSRTLGSPLLFIFALLWYSAFVIDAQALTASSQACINGYGKGTYFDSDSLKSNTDFTMICNNINFGVTVAVDLLMFFVVFVVWRAWGHCEDRYNSSGPLAAKDGSDVIPAAGGKAAASSV